MQKRAVHHRLDAAARAPPTRRRGWRREVERVVWPWIEAGKVKPVIDRTFPLAEAAKAHALLDSGHHLGKVVLTVS